MGEDDQEWFPWRRIRRYKRTVMHLSRRIHVTSYTLHLDFCRALSFSFISTGKSWRRNISSKLSLRMARFASGVVISSPSGKTAEPIVASSSNASSTDIRRRPSSRADNLTKQNEFEIACLLEKHTLRNRRHPSGPNNPLGARSPLQDLDRILPPSEPRS
jgi:hypothetical protein